MKIRLKMPLCVLSLIPLICESETIAIGSQTTYEEIKANWPSNSAYVAYDVRVKVGDSFSPIYNRVVIDHRDASPGFLPENTRDYFMPIQQYHLLYDASDGSCTGTVWGVEHYVRSLSDFELSTRLREISKEFRMDSPLDKIPLNYHWDGFRTQYAILKHCHSNSVVCSYQDGRLFSVTLYDQSQAPRLPARRIIQFGSDEIDLRNVRVMMQRNRDVVPDFDCWWKTNTAVGARYRTEAHRRKFLSQWKNSSRLGSDAQSFYAMLDRLFPDGPAEVTLSYFPTGFEGYIYQDEMKMFCFTTSKTPLHTMMNKEDLRDIFINCRILHHLKRIRITDDETLPLDLTSCSQNSSCKFLTKTKDGRNLVYQYKNCALLFFKDSGLAYVLFGAFGMLGEFGMEERLEGVVYGVQKTSGEIPAICGLHEINYWR